MEKQTLKCVRNAEKNILIQSGMNNTETEKTWEERQDGSDLEWETRNVRTVPWIKWIDLVSHLDWLNLLFS